MAETLVFIVLVGYEKEGFNYLLGSPVVATMEIASLPLFCLEQE